MTGTPRLRVPVPADITTEWGVFREMMRKRRRDLGLRQSDVSEAMGRSSGFAATVENYGSSPNILTVMMWAKALGGTLTVTFPPDDEGSSDGE